MKVETVEKPIEAEPEENEVVFEIAPRYFIKQTEKEKEHGKTT
jgi:hypothetical protein